MIGVYGAISVTINSGQRGQQRGFRLLQWEKTSDNFLVKISRESARELCSLAWHEAKRSAIRGGEGGATNRIRLGDHGNVAIGALLKIGKFLPHDSEKENL